jgi:hypothetical protein
MSIGNFIATILLGWVVKREQLGKPVPVLSWGHKLEDEDGKDN